LVQVGCRKGKRKVEKLKGDHPHYSLQKKRKKEQTKSPQRADEQGKKGRKGKREGIIETSFLSLQKRRKERNRGNPEKKRSTPRGEKRRRTMVVFQVNTKGGKGKWVSSSTSGNELTEEEGTCPHLLIRKEKKEGIPKGLKATRERREEKENVTDPVKLEREKRKKKRRSKRTTKGSRGPTTGMEAPDFLFLRKGKEKG